MRLAFLSYNARGFSNKNAIECIVGVVEARANLKEHKRMHREIRGAAKFFQILKCLYNSAMQESEEIVRAAACDVKLGLNAPTLLYNIC